jgi:formylglycine-generating enzyme required for sulfatase activity
MTTPVGAFPPNAWGLYDMHGNLWQWCQDIHGTFSDQAVTDPQGPTMPTAGRTFRGGCWMMDASNCWSAARGAGIDDQGFHFCGFRLCFVAE